MGRITVVGLGPGDPSLVTAGTLAAIDRKLEENRGQSDSLYAKVGRALAARRDGCQRQYVSRQEFGAFTATINHKIDSIYEFLKKDERTLDR